MVIYVMLVISAALDKNVALVIKIIAVINVMLKSMLCPLLTESELKCNDGY